MTIDSARGGKTEATATWLLGNLNAGETQSFVYPTGSGGHVIAASAIRKWKETNPQGTALVITIYGQLAEQWERHGVQAITRMTALRELRQKGTILGQDPATVGLLILEEASQIRRKDGAELMQAFPKAAILQMLSGGGSEPRPERIAPSPFDIGAFAGSRA